jgi:hypothetical protein
MFFTDKYLLTRNAKPGLKAQEIQKTRISLLLFSALQIIVPIGKKASTYQQFSSNSSHV